MEPLTRRSSIRRAADVGSYGVGLARAIFPSLPDAGALMHRRKHDRL
jgi:hypothetical protein